MTPEELVDFYKTEADDNQVKINKLVAKLQQQDELIVWLKQKLSQKQDLDFSCLIFREGKLI